jgi:hypothetical protein
VRVVGDGLDVLVGVRVEVLPGLPLIPPARHDVVEMRDDAGGDEELAMLVVIEPPGIAGAMREDLKLMPHGMVTPHAGIDGLALVIRRARLADAAVREDAMAAIQPAVRAPDEAVERFVRVLGAPAVEEGVGGEVEAGDLRERGHSFRPDGPGMARFTGSERLVIMILVGMNIKYGAAPTHTPPNPSSMPLTRFRPSQKIFFVSKVPSPSCLRGS